MEKSCSLQLEKESEWVNEWVSDWASDNEWVNERVSEWVSEWMSEWVNIEWVNERVSEWMNKRVSEWMNEYLLFLLLLCSALRIDTHSSVQLVGFPPLSSLHLSSRAMPKLAPRATVTPSLVPPWTIQLCPDMRTNFIPLLQKYNW